MADRGILLFSLKGEQLKLAKDVAAKLDIGLAPLEAGFFANKETKLNIKASVRGRTVYVLQVCDNDPNDCIMQLLITCYALKMACAQTVVGVIPYLPYSKQSKMRNRGAITCKLMATMLCRAGMDHILTLDLHSKEIQGFFECPVDNLRASPFLIQYVQEHIPDYREAIIVAKHPGAAARANSFAERLHLGIAVINGNMTKSDSDKQDGRQSPPPGGAMMRSRHTSEHVPYNANIPELGSSPGTSAGVAAPEHRFIPFHTDVIPLLEYQQLKKGCSARSAQAGVYSLDGNFGLPTKIKLPMEVVGDVSNRTCIIVEGMIDDAETLVVAAKLLRNNGAKRIYVLATHGLFSGEAPQLIENSEIDEVIVSNTVPVDSKLAMCSKIRVVDISPVLAEAVRRMHNGESLSYLFRNIPLED